MTELTFYTKNNTPFNFTIPSPSDRKSFFAFSLPKAGSTLLMNVLKEICQICQHSIIDLPTHIFTLGIQTPFLSEDVNQLWKPEGYAYIGFRILFDSFDFDLSSTKNIFLIRDPRDMLVSLYFSLRYSHVIPVNRDRAHPLHKQREDLSIVEINEAILNLAPALKNNFKSYISRLPVNSTRIYKYEDIIFNKFAWAVDMLDFLQISVKPAQLRQIIRKHDIQPKKENQHVHIRQVTPGNHKKHLTDATIQKLNNIFAAELAYFGYKDANCSEYSKEFDIFTISPDTPPPRILNSNTLLFNKIFQLAQNRMIKMYKRYFLKNQ
jgi:hypothetical protein